jgi:hypothetical protein
MFGITIRNRDSSRRAQKRAFGPRLEGLEDRKLLYATTGNLWAYGSHITYSIAPDGTSIGGVPSNLYQALASDGITTTAWQNAIAKAAAAWQAAANINLVQVSDDGEAFGTAGDQQGDPRFGDIRIGGTPLTGGVLGMDFRPPAANGGTLAGDFVLNTTQAWHVNSDYDLQTVAIHEFGHALGMDHSGLTTAAMYYAYSGMKQSLTSDDTQGIQSVYGPRPADPIGNNTFATATPVTIQGAGQATVTSSLSGATDYDYYYVVAPASTSGTLTVTMQATNLSMLAPKVAVFNSNQVGLTSCGSTTNGATVTVTVAGVTPGQAFYIKAMAGAAGASATGAYGLEINFSSTPMNPVQAPVTVVAQQADQGGGSSDEVADTFGAKVHVGQHHPRQHHHHTHLKKSSIAAAPVFSASKVTIRHVATLSLISHDKGV